MMHKRSELCGYDKAVACGTLLSKVRQSVGKEAEAAGLLLPLNEAD